VTTLGDLLLDVIVHLDGPLVPDDDRPATTRACAGGQAANVAAWAATLGADARYVGKRGDDDAGEIIAHELAGYGVDVIGPRIGRTGIVVSIAESGERSMASDRGSAPELRPDELELEWFAADALFISGYALMREPIADAAARAAELAREQGAFVTVDLATWTLFDATFRERVHTLAPDIVFANEREYEEFGSCETRWIVKRGADGVVVDGVAHAALPTNVIDPTGAGDAFAGGFLAGGVTLGLEAAARCCAKLGAMP
jgi:sugar/nucleoside kinase (ribokinase family)